MISDKPLTEEELAGRALFEVAKEVITLFKERRWLNNGASRYFEIIQRLIDAVERYRIATEDKTDPEILY
jgi:hypothetical protein